MTIETDFHFANDYLASEIRESSLKQTQNDGKNHRGRYPEHQRSICCLKWSQQFPCRRHDHITIAERGIVHRRVIVGGSKLLKLPANDEYPRPHGDFNQMCRECE